MGTRTKIIRACLALCLCFYGAVANAAVVRHALTVESIDFDDWSSGVQVGDVLGHLEYDNTGLVRWDQTGPGLVEWTTLTAFSLEFAGNTVGLGDLVDTVQVVLDDDYLYDHPYTMFSAESEDMIVDVLAADPYTYLVTFVDANDWNVGAVMTIKSSVVPVPAAVWLFGSALAGLGWIRRKQAT